MRTIFCDFHQHTFRGHGTSRVLGKMVFHFCQKCWDEKRGDCEEHMRKMAGIPETGFATKKQEATV